MSGVIRMFDRRPLSLRGSEETAAEIARKRPESETHLTERHDRVGPYLINHMKEFGFDEFSRAYLERTGLTKELSGIPIPLRAEDREAFNTDDGLKSNIIAENMARVLGMDPKFKYKDIYVTFIDRLFGNKGVENMTRKAKDHADLEEYDDACICFRAALVLKFDDLAAIYGYARVLRAMYGNGKNEEYVGNLKAESLDYFEMATELYPRFDMAWYYLGYMYLNLGLYMKARLAWKEYLKYGHVAKDRREIRKRIAQIAEPVEIEQGTNAVLAGRWSKGLELLEPYKESKFNDWWPLWYYLGVAYARTGRPDEAESAFKQALRGSPRHIESMEELAALYEKAGDKAGVKKYRDKLALLSKKDVDTP